MKFTRITVKPDQMDGMPCIRGLRIPVATVVGMAADGLIDNALSSVVAKRLLSGGRDAILVRDSALACEHQTAYNLPDRKDAAMKHERIEINPKVMLGKPVIKGTRLTVELILRKLGAGVSEQQILEDHPRLTREDIRAALAFAADYMHDDEVIFASA
ncbi:MAG TPA: DUF433 domain-containing protein [Rhizomicrobium sp.]|jgi:uncharacterized protein (DUF433 family)|nr:DUF433 domain-containing protein [Rhizomicrobium sp.]